MFTHARCSFVISDHGLFINHKFLCSQYLSNVFLLQYSALSITRYVLFCNKMYLFLLFSIICMYLLIKYFAIPSFSCNKSD